jgi:hypothetical protein
MAGSDRRGLPDSPAVFRVSWGAAAGFCEANRTAGEVAAPRVARQPGRA